MVPDQIERFWRYVESMFRILDEKEARSRGFFFCHNIHGDAINHLGYRSEWKDEYGIIWACSDVI